MSRRIRYSRALGDYIVDSRCKCGHLESEHGSETTKLSTLMLRHPHAGNCCESQCACPRFTWESFVTLEEKAAMLAVADKTRECVVDNLYVAMA